MGISSDHIPFSRSLQQRILRDFAPEGAEPAATLATADAVAFLGHSTNTDTSPLATIRRRAAEQDLTAQLSARDHAILTWVCRAFSDWEERFSLEAPLRDRLHRLLPLAVAMALRDDSFLAPGNHPLHRLLDALQAGAVGWQVRLDRAGQMLEQRVERAVEKALDWFSDDRTDIASITRELIAANERDAARAGRMVQRLAEMEAARLRKLSARRDAAMFINTSLVEFELPAAIGEFLKGPWYDSAQLVLVRHGENSREWEQMQRTTYHLIESVQGINADEAAQREQLIRHLPGELRRWLLSLEHDSEATDSAIGLVEYAHLRLQHGQQLPCMRVASLEIDDEPAVEKAVSDDDLRCGDWYCFEDQQGELRAQLVLQMEDGRHLLFANFVGLKALDLSHRSFTQRLEEGLARHLPNIATFSLSLASAAGIDSEDRFRQFIDPGYRPPDEAAGTAPPEEPEELHWTLPAEAPAGAAKADDNAVPAPVASAGMELILELDDVDSAGSAEEHSPAPAAIPDALEIDIPMGAWLGFHDGETPIMGKLAVYDPQRDNYIFVNRKGIARRELSGAEMLALMDRGLVDILETRSYFRDEVARARERDR